MTQSKFYIPSLDGMRTVAFIIVFLSHAGLNHIIPGAFGVTIFFFLSGYLIATLLRREYEVHQFINLKHFYLRRILRIWPGFYLILFLATILTLAGVFKESMRLSAFLSQILHYYNYSNPKSFSITGSQALPGNRCKRGSASPAKMEAEPPDLRYQALPGNE